MERKRLNEDQRSLLANGMEHAAEQYEKNAAFAESQESGLHPEAAHRLALTFRAQAKQTRELSSMLWAADAIELQVDEHRSEEVR